MQKVFSNESGNDVREILIKIEDGIIEFFFYEQYRQNQEWLKEETQKRVECGEPELTDDEKANSNFYWIEVENWVKDKTERQGRSENWHEHMKRKNWFTKEMSDFINQNT